MEITRFRLSFVIFLFSLIVGLVCTPVEAVRFDFETGDLQGWRVMEGGFGKLISDREMCRNTAGAKLNKQGKYFLGTLELPNDEYNDYLTGVIESPVFVLKSDRVSFIIGGGGHSETYLALYTIDGEQHFIARGNFDESFTRVVWDTSGLVGKKVFLQIVDLSTSCWGHIVFDDFQAEGEIDLKSTEEIFSTYEKRKQFRIARENAKFKPLKESRLKQLTSDSYLYTRGSTKVYTGEYLKAISFPIGGIGAGCIQMDGTGRPAVWQIFNNFSNHFIPDSFFAVRVAIPGGRPVIRALQTNDIGPFTGMKTLTFRGEYPIAWYDFQDPSLPIKIQMEVFSPFIPLRVRDSSMPCAIFKLTAHNTGKSNINVSFLATQQNAVGFTGKSPVKGVKNEDYGRNINEIIHRGNYTVLHMTADIPTDSPGYGDMALAALSNSTSGRAEWTDLTDLYKQFELLGSIIGNRESGPTSNGQTINGALSCASAIKPGEKYTVTFVLAWNFPNAKHGNVSWGGNGNMYSNWWPNSLGTVNELSTRLSYLAKETHLNHETFYQTNLPFWMLDRLTSQTAILRTKTCFWAKNGYFGGWEGCLELDGCCAGNCSHVWHYAQAHARLFPEIGRRMREQAFSQQFENGGIPHRLYPGFEVAADGQFGEILATYREHLNSSDGKWLKKHWAKCVRAIEYAIKTWDPDENGVMSGRQWNTLDAALGGSSSWIGSLYLASLAACEKMALIQGDINLSNRYNKILSSGKKNQNETLWNGEYYFQIPEAEPMRDYNNGCHIDQVLGQWWANQLNLGWIYPKERVAKSMESLWKYNFHAGFQGVRQMPRKFVPDEESGMQMISYPHGGKPDPQHEIPYADEVMTGFEYSAAATMIQAGKIKEGFATARAVYDRYDGRLKSGLTYHSWCYSGNPFGDDECGKFYSRAMSVWSILLAAQGFIYDGPAGVIGFKPIWKPNNHVSFFTGAEGYGLFHQKIVGDIQTDRIAIKSGRLRLKRLIFELPENRKMLNATVSLGSRKLKAECREIGKEVVIEMSDELLLSSGESLNIDIKTRKST